MLIPFIIKSYNNRKMRLIKYISILILISISSTPAQAEYNGHHIEFTIETQNGDLIKAFIYKTNLPYLINDTIYDFLEKNYDCLLDSETFDGIENLVYYENRLRYEYPNSALSASLSSTESSEP